MDEIHHSNGIYAYVTEVKDQTTTLNSTQTTEEEEEKKDKTKF